MVQAAESRESDSHGDTLYHGFFDLPGEIRNSIYEMVFVHDKPLKPCRYNGPKHCGQQPSITLVCRRLRHEALPFFYSLNTFDIYWGVRCSSWARATGAANLARLKSVFIGINPIKATITTCFMANVKLSQDGTSIEVGVNARLDDRCRRLLLAELNTLVRVPGEEKPNLAHLLSKIRDGGYIEIEADVQLVGCDGGVVPRGNYRMDSLTG
jgi:hypothetical protein